MNLVLKVDLDVIKMYHHAKMKFLCQVFQNLQPELTDRQTDRQTDSMKTLSSHIRAVKIS